MSPMKGFFPTIQSGHNHETSPSLIWFSSGTHSLWKLAGQPSQQIRSPPNVHWKQNGTLRCTNFFDCFFLFRLNDVPDFLFRFNFCSLALALLPNPWWCLKQRMWLRDILIQPAGMWLWWKDWGHRTHRTKFLMFSSGRASHEPHTWYGQIKLVADTTWVDMWGVTQDSWYLYGHWEQETKSFPFLHNKHTGPSWHSLQ